MNPENYTPQQPTSQTPPLSPVVLPVIAPFDLRPEPQPPRRNTKLIFLAIITALFVIIAAGIVLMSSQPKTSHELTCAQNSGYQKLAETLRPFNADDTDVATMSSQEVFYTEFVYYKANSSRYADNDTQLETQNLVTALGSYYKQYGAEAPISISLQSNFVTGTPTDINQQRTTTLKEALTRAGLPTEKITIHTPREIQNSDDNALDASTATISVTPSLTCTPSDI